MNPLYFRTTMKHLILSLVWAVGLSAPLYAQNKQVLDHDAYEIWNLIEEEAIAPNGEWVLASLGPQDGDAELRVTAADGNQTYTVPRGVKAHFAPNSPFAVFHIKAPKDSLIAAKRAEKKDDALPKDSLGILNLQTGAVVKVPRVKSFQLPENAGTWVAYHLEKPLTDSTKAKPAKGKGTKKANGTPLVLRQLQTGAAQTLEHVTAYRFSKNGAWLVYATASTDSTADGLFAVSTATGTVTPILTGPGDYSQLAIDEAGTQVAFLTNRDDFTAEQPAYALYYWTPQSSAATLLAQAGTPGLPDDWGVNENGKIHFSKQGERLFFGSAPLPESEEKDPRAASEKVNVEIWTWNDPLLQPMQKKQVDTEQKRSYQAVVHLPQRQVVQLASEEVPDVKVGAQGNADIALGWSNRPYQKQISWDYPAYYDVYVIDVQSGGARLIQEEVQAQPDLSPAGRYITWWDRDALAWFAASTADATPRNLTADLPHAVHREDHDWPYAPNPYGQAGWTDDDAEWLVYDKHDIWVLDPTGAHPPRNVTNGYGREENLRLRYVRLDPEDPTITPDLLLSAFQYTSKVAGFYRTEITGDAAPQKLVMMDRKFSAPQKAKAADVLLYTRSSYTEFPDLWVSDLNLSGARKLTTANPQQDQYLWGSVELVEWTSLDGQMLQGLLYKPEGFDPAEQYPMMVYFYEKNSNNLHNHWAPQPHRSIINFTFYASRGYLVFVPDIPYKVGYPGESALNAILPGTLSLIEQGFVDRDRVGVQGHSWGGYQIAYLVTRTQLFRAAEAGAPVSNMFSAYGGIRWGSGMSRMFQYEKTQSRIGGSIWEKPLRYLENSPIFWADKIETPLLIMHNDQDGAVPWYQGIELFVALRRLDKPTWMINYTGEPHWPTTYPNKKDWTIRMQQYFDHYLKDAPAPAWMTEGVPALKKDKTLGLEPTEY